MSFAAIRGNTMLGVAATVCLVGAHVLFGWFGIVFPIVEGPVFYPHWRIWVRCRCRHRIDTVSRDVAASGCDGFDLAAVSRAMAGKTVAA